MVPAQRRTAVDAYAKRSERRLLLQVTHHGRVLDAGLSTMRVRPGGQAGVPTCGARPNRIDDLAGSVPGWTLRRRWTRRSSDLATAAAVHILRRRHATGTSADSQWCSWLCTIRAAGDVDPPGVRRRPTCGTVINSARHANRHGLVGWSAGTGWRNAGSANAATVDPVRTPDIIPDGATVQGRLEKPPAGS